MRFGPDVVFGLKDPEPVFPNFQTVLDLKTWSALPYEHLSPLSLMEMNKLRAFDGDMPSAFARQTGDFTSLLEHACRCGFWELPESTLDRLAKNKLGNELHGDLFDKLFTIIQHVLQCEDLEVVMCIERRTARKELRKNTMA